MSDKLKCPFCAYQTQNVIAETDSFVFIRPTVPIVAEEILVIPKHHANALTLLNGSDKEGIDRIWRSYVEFLGDYKLGVIYEHGNHAYDNEPWHEHAHIHLLPISLDLSSICLPLADEVHDTDILSSSPIEQEYVFCTNSEHKPSIFVLSQKLERKFLKRVCQGIPDNVALYPEKRSELCATRIVDFIMKGL